MLPLNNESSNRSEFFMRGYLHDSACVMSRDLALHYCYGELLQSVVQMAQALALHSKLRQLDQYPEKDWIIQTRIQLCFCVFYLAAWLTICKSQLLHLHVHLICSQQPAPLSSMQMGKRHHLESKWSARSCRDFFWHCSAMRLVCISSHLV